MRGDRDASGRGRLMGYRLGIDTGRHLHRPDPGRRRWHGRAVQDPSTPADPPQAIRDGLESIASALGVAVGEFLGDCDLIIHGTTVALNTLIQLKGARVGLFCTRGHEDSLEIRNGHKEDGHRYDFLYPPARCLCPGGCGSRSRERVLERRRRCGRRSTSRTSTRGIERFGANGVDAVGVCFLWSFLHPEHERRVGEILARGAA